MTTHANHSADHFSAAAQKRRTPRPDDRLPSELMQQVDLPARQTIIANPGMARPDDILTLQCMAGNRAVSHLIQTRPLQATGVAIQRENEEKKPPTKKEIHEAWLEKWEWWKKQKRKYKKKLEAQYPNDPDRVADELDQFSIDCGVKARQVLLSLGGERHKTVFRGKWHPDYCKPEEGKQARSRYKAGKWDKINSDTLYTYNGKGTTATETAFSLEPGMLIYSAEKARPFTEEEVEKIAKKKKGEERREKTRKWLEKIWRWENRHMVMYYGDGDKILDSVNLARPTPRSFPHNFYAEEAELFVVLRVYDPFIDMR